LRQRIAQGQLGRVFKIMAEMPQDSYMRLQNQGKSGLIQTWRLQDGEIPCLSLDLFVHLHSLVHFLTGAAPREVRATSRSISGVRDGLIDEVDALIACDGDLQVNAWYGKAALGVRNGLRMRVFGTRGSMEWYQEEPESIRLANADGDLMLLDRISTGSGQTAAPRYNRFKAGHPAGFIEAFANYYWDVAEAMVAGKPNEYTLSVATAAEGIALCDAIARASGSGEAAKLTREQVR
ncbi:MAG: Gfo/Idh/MocA family oxidoreductase, partial [Gammaproteobacteria bacterium]